MGMFDYLRCKAPLPLPQYQDRLFQTKDTPPQLCLEVEITEDGRLLCPEDESGETDTFSGLLGFYDLVDRENVEGWVEFEALFDHGRMVWIELVTHELPEGE